MKLPKELADMTRGLRMEQNTIGCSTAKVYRFTGSGAAFYLKIDKGLALRQERDALLFLRGKLPVASIAYYSEDTASYLLTTALPGTMACNLRNLRKPQETAFLLSEATKLFHSVPPSECPLDRTLDVCLREAYANMKQGLANCTDNPLGSPEALYRFLDENRPEEELVVCHGDFCLPNILLHEGSVSGFVDLGSCGIADKWQDITFCLRSIRWNFGPEAAPEIQALYLEHLGIPLDEKKFFYYRMLNKYF